MGTMKTALKTVTTFTSDNLPTILTILGCGGVISTTVHAVRVTPKAMLYLKDREAREQRPLTKKEILDEVWKLYLPTMIMGSTTIACIIGANHISKNRAIALASLYSLSENTLKEYKEKVIEQIGEKKEEQIRDEIAKDRIALNPPQNNEVVVTGKGDYLCYDVMNGRYFRSDIESIRKVVNDMNHELRTEMWITLNEVYYELGLRPTKQGDLCGWDPDHPIYFSYSSQLSESGEPCLVIEYQCIPRPKYMNY